LLLRLDGIGYVRFRLWQRRGGSDHRQGSKGLHQGPARFTKFAVHGRRRHSGSSAYSQWKPVKTPWTLCFNNSYLGNTWRAAALAEFNVMAKQYKAAGLVTKYLSTNSNLSLPTQIQQMDDLINVDHCSGIITIPTGTSGMDAVIKQAYLKGIPVVDDLGPTTSPYAENFDENWYTSAVAQANFWSKQYTARETCST